VGYFLPLHLLFVIGAILLVIGVVLYVLPSVGGPTVNGPIRGRWY
jgi:hypothetical protein